MSLNYTYRSDFFLYMDQCVDLLLMCAVVLLLAEISHCYYCWYWSTI